jgi:opacity protein-like surface antigen
MNEVEEKSKQKLGASEIIDDNTVQGRISHDNDQKLHISVLDRKCGVMNSFRMTKITTALVTVFAFASLAQAAPRNNNRVNAAPISQNNRVTTSYSAPSSSGSDWAFGLQSADLIFGTAIPALSGIWHMDTENSLQFLAVIPNTSPFHWGVGGLFKHNLRGDNTAGLHVGGGVGLGTNNSAFYVSIAPVVGVHFEVANNIQISVDATPVLAIVDGDATFRLGGISSLLGLGIHYRY